MKRALLILVSSCLLGSGCSLGPKQAWAEEIRDGFERASAASTARVSFRAGLAPEEGVVIRVIPKPLFSAAAGVVDFKERRARLAITKPPSRKGSVFFDDLVVYLPRSKAVRVSDKRRFARFDFEREPSEDLDDNDRRVAVGAGLISPVIAVEMLDGVLAGSVERRGTERKGGVSTTRYEAKLSQDAAAREIDDEDRREGVLRAFESLGVREDVFRVNVWLDADGVPRGIKFFVRQQKDRVNVFDTTMSWEFLDYGTPGVRGAPDNKADILLPLASDTVKRGRLRTFVPELTREAV